MKRSLAILLPFVSWMIGCQGISESPSQEKEIELGAYRKHIVFNLHEMKGDTLKIKMLYHDYPFNLQESMARADTAQFDVHYTNTSVIDTTIITKNTWAEEYSFPNWGLKNKKPFFIDAYVLGNDKK